MRMAPSKNKKTETIDIVLNEFKKRKFHVIPDHILKTYYVEKSDYKDNQQSSNTGIHALPQIKKTKRFYIPGITNFSRTTHYVANNIIGSLLAWILHLNDCKHPVTVDLASSCVFVYYNISEQTDNNGDVKIQYLLSRPFRYMCVITFDEMFKAIRTSIVEKTKCSKDSYFEEAQSMFNTNTYRTHDDFFEALYDDKQIETGVIQRYFGYDFRQSDVIWQICRDCIVYKNNKIQVK